MTRGDIVGRGDELPRGVTVLPAPLCRGKTQPDRIEAIPIPEDTTALCP